MSPVVCLSSATAPPGRRESPGGPWRPSVPFCLQGELVTASKAIIEKEYQPHVIVSTTGPNPFTTLTDRELEEYRKEVERKQKGPEGERPRGPRGDAAACGRLVLRGLQVHVLTSPGLVLEDVKGNHGSNWSGREGPESSRERGPACSQTWSGGTPAGLSTAPARGRA